MPQSLHGELLIAHAQRRINAAGVERESIAFASVDIADVEFLRLPRCHAGENLFRKHPGIGCSAECLTREDRGRLVMAMVVTSAALKTRRNHVGAERANRPHNVG